MKRKRKRQKKKIRYLLYFIPLVLIGLFIYYKFEYKKVDFLEDRVSQLEKAQKKDTDTKSTIGWLRVQGTNIDMPVVYFEDGILKNKLIPTANINATIAIGITFFFKKFLNIFFITFHIFFNFFIIICFNNRIILYCFPFSNHSSINNHSCMCYRSIKSCTRY